MTRHPGSADNEDSHAGLFTRIGGRPAAEGGTGARFEIRGVSDYPKVAIFACSPECRHGGGAFLITAFRHYARDRLLFVDQPEFVLVPVLWEHSERSLARELLASFQTVLYHLVYSLGLARVRIRPVLRLIEEWGAEKVMIIVHSETAVLYLACALLKSFPSVYLVVHDPPDRQAAFYRWPFRSVLGTYVSRWLGWALRRARRVGVNSSSMAVEYRNLFGVASESLVPGAPAELIVSGDVPKMEQFRLAFAGSAYAKDAWCSLLEALSQEGWEIDGRDVYIDYLGEPPAWFPKNPRICVHGWKDLADAVDILSRAHACYLPYWLHSGFDESVRLCFPSKLGTYLAAGRAVFYHGPLCASPMELFTRYPAAVCCHVSEPAAISECLRRLTDLDLNRELSRQAHLAATEVVNERAFSGRFAQFLESPTGSTRKSHCNL